ncbi:expressed protein [Phakopsora pachyrhizi]|uniref:Expressed protein n=1 Tax=Phakopsora pachyrhizi TaxID=170000 RepID=A0AAV0AH04_PHAPC|nr:expressed protein [Phakopsora pachyrhizi]
MMIKNRASDNNQTDINTNNSLSSRNDQLYKNRFIDWFKASNYEILDLNGNVLIMADKVGSDSIGATDENFNSFGWPQGGFQQNSSQPLSFNNSTSTPTPKASEPLHQNLLANRSSDNLNKSLNDEKNSISIGSKHELNQYGSLKFFPGYDELIVPPGGTNNESSRTMPGIVGGSGGLNENCNLPNSSIEAQQNNFFENPNCSDFFGDGVTDNREGLMIHNQNQAYQQQQLQQQLDAQSYNKNNHYNEQFFNQTIIPQPPQTNHLHHHQQQQQQQLQQHHLQHQHPYHLTTPNHQPNIHLQQFHYNQQSQQQPHSSINDSNLNQIFQQ